MILSKLKSLWNQRPFHENIFKQILALKIWVCFWVVFQHLSVSLEWNDIQQISGFLAVLIIISGLLIGLARSWAYRLFTSVPFAIAQLVFMAASVALGTLILQELKFSEYLDIYGSVWWGDLPLVLVRYAFAYDLYRSLWFLSLLALLSASTLSVAWKRRPYTLPRGGFLLVHLATSVILLGGLMGKFGFVRAFNELQQNQPVTVFWKVKGPDPNNWKNPFSLPFSVRLDQFEVIKHDPEYRLYAFTQPDGKGGFEDNPKSYDAEAGFKTRLPLTWKRLEILQTLPDGLNRSTWINDVTAPENPVLQVMLGTGTPNPLLGFLVAQDLRTQRFNDPQGRFALLFNEEFKPRDLGRFKRSEPKSHLVQLTFAGKTFDKEFKKGSIWDFPVFKLKMVRLFKDFPFKNDPNGRPVKVETVPPELRGNWAELELITNDGQQAKILLSARNPEFSKSLNAGNLPPGLSLQYKISGEESFSNFVVFSKNDMKIRSIENGRILKESPLVLDRPFIFKNGFSATPLSLLLNARVEGKYIPNPQARPISERNPAVQVTLSDPRTGKSETVWLDGREAKPTTFFDKKIGLIYRLKDQEARDFRSKITLLDTSGKILAQKEISVNDPLVYEGLWFYQSNYNPEDPTVSGIMVVYEPGLWVTYFGFAMIVIGTIWMFYLKPIFLKRSGRLTK
ncbi:MAG: cytochrome c biogenesis protein ResB [Holophagaceae bacterium]